MTANTRPLPATDAQPIAAPRLAAYLQAQRDALVAAEGQALDGDATAYIGMLGAVRRARSALTVYRATVGGHREIRRLIEELRWFGYDLDLFHDLDVQRTRIAAALALLRPSHVQGPVRARIGAYFDVRIRPARIIAEDALDSDRYRTLRGDLADVVGLLHGSAAWPDTHPVDDSIAELVDRMRLRMHTVTGALGEDAHDAAVHDVRKVVRRARYFAEAMRDLDPVRFDHARTELAAVQDLLGEHHDAVVAKNHLVQLAREADNADEPTFTYGMLCQRQLDITERCGRELPAACARALEALAACRSSR
ncbi:CHAD domain-containing protein [Nocardia farcinica]|uniref:Uncharacterized conserved protein n=1 Tax=Nocardia farcinica TaxID=37329 RepID=A0A0H5NLJ9_NOCFR|nr:CHAD domain-containing protein [Nocardia farcinica]AXK85362.1 CHAD domain-containing protein [Nocardia farcinica]PFX05324.1 hypothetical protein CJ469_00734 [Nocardia farcinica]CRY76815.1 Uncharacterized conserved protein [Nocardia farcinica]SIS79875.1 CHAD domain-containing protein [Nocardia farcinica]